MSGDILKVGECPVTWPMRRVGGGGRGLARRGEGLQQGSERKLKNRGLTGRQRTDTQEQRADSKAANADKCRSRARQRGQQHAPQLLSVQYPALSSQQWKDIDSGGDITSKGCFGVWKHLLGRRSFSGPCLKLHGRHPNRTW
eukprot:365106-Chlamydomonas_euryale.AAC.2